MGHGWMASKRTGHGLLVALLMEQGNSGNVKKGNDL